VPSTVKAHFIHTARDLNDSTTWYNPGPDYASGYGVLDIKAAVDQLRSGNWSEGVVDQGQDTTIYLDVPVPGPVKITVAWDDAPAAPGTTGAALVNDLDLIVTDPMGIRHYPWTLDPANPSADAIRGREDHLNNVEVVSFDAGYMPAGRWTVRVRGTSVPGGPQVYSLVYSHSPVCLDNPLITWEPGDLLPEFKQTVCGHADLVVPYLTLSGHPALGAGVWALEATRNIGEGTARESWTAFFWSQDTVWDSSDVYLNAREIPALNPGERDPDNAPSPTPVMIPPNAANGTHYILAVADAAGVVAENFKTNNTAAVPVTIMPDLMVASLAIAGVPVPGQSIRVQAAIKNKGTGWAGASLTRYFWSTDTSYNPWTDVLIGARTVTSLFPGVSDPTSGTTDTVVTIPTTATNGNYYILVVANASGTVTESSGANNVSAIRVSIAADLVVLSLTVSGCASPSASISVSDLTWNRGPNVAPASSMRFYWSPDARLDAGDGLVAQRSVRSLAASQTEAASTWVTVPWFATQGTYYVFAVANADRNVIETSVDNNVSVVPVEVRAPYSCFILLPVPYK
jgi:hypothetical protein